MTLPLIPLWDFSLALYGSPNVERICLTLQDEFKAKVNLLLWCCWLEARGIRLTPLRLEQALQRTASWEESVIKPLRQLRQAIKQEYGVGEGAVEACRQKIKMAELAAEKVELDSLEALAGEWAGDSLPLRPGENLAGYLKYIDVPEQQVAVALAVLVHPLEPR